MVGGGVREGNLQKLPQQRADVSYYAKHHSSFSPTLGVFPFSHPPRYFPRGTFSSLPQLTVLYGVGVCTVTFR